MKGKLLLTAILAATSSMAFAADKAPSNCASVSEADISALFERWNASLQTGDASKVASNYADDAVLLPTVSNQVRLTRDERIDYFEHFLEKKPVGTIDSRTIRIGCDKAIDSGTYTFKFDDKSEVNARFTFTYKWDGDNWLITSHHSSAMPEA